MTNGARMIMMAAALGVFSAPALALGDTDTESGFRGRGPRMSYDRKLWMT